MNTNFDSENHFAFVICSSTVFQVAFLSPNWDEAKKQPRGHHSSDLHFDRLSGDVMIQPLIERRTNAHRHQEPKYNKSRCNTGGQNHCEELCSKALVGSHLVVQTHFSRTGNTSTRCS
jgi:hypothetical protein